MPITYVGSQTAVTTSDTAQSVSVNMPAGVQAGDMLLAVVGVTGEQLSSGGSDPGVATPSGWTFFAGGFDAPTVSTSYGFRLNVYYRKATGSETSVTFTSASPGGKVGVSVNLYRGADTLNGYAVTLNPGSGTSSSYVTNAVNIGDGVRLMSAYGDRTGSSEAFSGGASYVRSRVESTNTTFEIGDSNGAVGAGSYKRTLAYTNPTGVGVFILFGMSATVDTPANPTVPPTLNYTVQSPVYAVDATQSSSGMGGAVSYTVEYVSGATLSYVQVKPGYFAFVADDTTDAQYNIVLNEAGNPASPIRQRVTLAAIDPNGTAAPPSSTVVTSINETVVLSNGAWR
jgi:hypothetical protein